VITAPPYVNTLAVPSGAAATTTSPTFVDIPDMFFNFTFPVPGVGIEDAGGALHPKGFSLRQNHPNPFNPSTAIRFDIPVSVGTGIPVRLDVFDLRGRRIDRLVEGVRAPGSYDVSWDGRDRSGRSVGSGVYVYRITAGGFTSTKKMVLLK